MFSFETGLSFRTRDFEVGKNVFHLFIASYQISSMRLKFYLTTKFVMFVDDASRNVSMERREEAVYGCLSTGEF